MQASGFEALGITFSGSRTVVANNESIVFRSVAIVDRSPSTSAVSSVELTLISAQRTPPLIRSATAQITASSVAKATLASVAQVRAAEGKATDSSSTLVVDFQAQRTVSQLDGPVAIANVQPWLGTKFDTQLGPLRQGKTTFPFQELQTERLLVTLDHATDPASFAQHGSVVIPTPPSNLELLVGSTRVWFRPGPAVGDGGAAFSHAVDVTDAVVTAAAAGQLPIVLTLRSSVPGSLSLTGTADLLQRYLVAFPEGITRTIEAPTEGVYPLALPISAASVAADGTPGPADWQVEQIMLDVSAKLPKTRVLPPDGPTLSADGELVVDQDHAFVVQLPPARISQLAELSGVRLPVRAGVNGAELAGTLRGGTHDAPGDALSKAQLGPVTLAAPAAGPSAPATWIDLMLAAPHKLADGEVVWLELQVARGSVVWPLAEPQADPHDDARLRWRTSSGICAALSAVSGLPPFVSAVRVVGTGKPNAPLPALAAAVERDTQSAPVACVPAPAGTTIILGLGGPATPTPVGGSADRELRLELTISTPGSYAVGSAELQYKATASGSVK